MSRDGRPALLIYKGLQFAKLMKSSDLGTGYRGIGAISGIGMVSSGM